MTNYQVTIGYKAVVCVDVKADNEKEAKEIAIKMFSKEKNKAFKTQKVALQDDNYNADGCLDMDATWHMYER